MNNDTQQQQGKALTAKPAGKDLPLVKGIPGITPRNFTEVMELANVMAKSDLVPKEMRGRPENVALAIMKGIELRLSVTTALDSIMVVNGRASIWGDVALAMVRDSGLLEEFEEDSAEKCQQQAFGRCRAKRKGFKTVEVVFSREMAQRARLAYCGPKQDQFKQGPWTEHTGRMFQVRARGWLLRDLFTDVLKGLHIREEVEDYIDTTFVESGRGPEVQRLSAPKAAAAAAPPDLPQGEQHSAPASDGQQAAAPELKAEAAPARPKWAGSFIPTGVMRDGRDKSVIKIHGKLKDGEAITVLTKDQDICRQALKAKDDGAELGFSCDMVGDDFWIEAVS